MDEPGERIVERLERPLNVATVLTIPIPILQLLPPPDPASRGMNVSSELRAGGETLGWLGASVAAGAVVVLEPDFRVPEASRRAGEAQRD